MFQQASQYFAQLGIGEHYKVNIRISVHTEANKHKICAKIAGVEQRQAYVLDFAKLSSSWHSSAS